MSVVCRQEADNSVHEYVIEPHFPEQTDEELLKAKFNGAVDKGWKITRSDPRSFVATKVRWGDVNCTRTFWID